MVTTCLVGCGSAKGNRPVPAKRLYTSSYFRLKREYAESECDEWYVLSAAHGVVDPDEILDPYDTTISDVDAERWSQDVLTVIGNLSFDRLVVLAGQDYIEPLRPEIDRYDVSYPLEGGIGEQMAWLKEQVNQSQSVDSWQRR